MPEMSTGLMLDQRWGHQFCLKDRVREGSQMRNTLSGFLSPDAFNCKSEETYTNDVISQGLLL